MSAKRRYELDFEGGKLRLDLPPSWEVAGVLRSGALPALPDVEAGLRAALETPVGCAPLAEGDLAGKRIVLVVEDHARPTPVSTYFGADRREAEAGAVDVHATPNPRCSRSASRPLSFERTPE